VEKTIYRNNFLNAVSIKHVNALLPTGAHKFSKKSKANSKFWAP
jgi:hypothetical protein